MAQQYDLIVIGAGPGGYPAALEAARLGKRTAVVEQRALGGTCLNRGCIPTKTLLYASGQFRNITRQENRGITLPREQVRLDAEKLHAHKKEVIAFLRDGIARQFKKHKIDLYEGTARITGAHTVEVAGKEHGTVCLEGTFILAAAGSKPAIPPLIGMELPEVVTSDELLEQDRDFYKRLVIIGGGVIGMEFACLYSDLGLQVTVMEAMDRILFQMDKEIAQNLKMILSKRGVEFHTGVSVKEIQRTEAGICCIFEEKGRECRTEGDACLIAAGRKSCTEGLFLNGLLTLDRGMPNVDENYQTEIPSIYAVGDMIGGIQLAHMAAAEGIAAVHHMFGAVDIQDRTVIPACVYTSPEIAAAGMNAEEAKAAGIEIVTGKYIMSVNAKSVLEGSERGFIKLIAEKRSRRILGAQLMCERATDMIGTLSLAISKGLLAEDIASVIMPHPTFSEGIREAAEAIVNT